MIPKAQRRPPRRCATRGSAPDAGIARARRNRRVRVRLLHDGHRTRRGRRAARLPRPDARGDPRHRGAAAHAGRLVGARHARARRTGRSKAVPSTARRSTRTERPWPWRGSPRRTTGRACGSRSPPMRRATFEPAVDLDADGPLGHVDVALADADAAVRELVAACERRRGRDRGAQGVAFGRARPDPRDRDEPAEPARRRPASRAQRRAHCFSRGPNPATVGGQNSSGGSRPDGSDMRWLVVVCFSASLVAGCVTHVPLSPEYRGPDDMPPSIAVELPSGAIVPLVVSGEEVVKHRPRFEVTARVVAFERRHRELDRVRLLRLDGQRADAGCRAAADLQRPADRHALLRALFREPGVGARSS